jgi:hypothetical protein
MPLTVIWRNLQFLVANWLWVRLICIHLRYNSGDRELGTMKKLTVIALLLVMPQFAAARVYMCVDTATGKTSFTDQACNAASVREEVRVPTANLDSGQRYATPATRKTWRSQADTRKTGTDYNAERRSLYENKATAGTQ